MGAVIGRKEVEKENQQEQKITPLHENGKVPGCRRFCCSDALWVQPVENMIGQHQTDQRCFIRMHAELAVVCLDTQTTIKYITKTQNYTMHCSCTVQFQVGCGFHT